MIILASADVNMCYRVQVSLGAMESMSSQKRTLGLTSGYERALQYALVLEDLAVVPLTSMLQITLSYYSLEWQPVAADLCSDSGHEGLKNTWKYKWLLQGMNHVHRDAVDCFLIWLYTRGHERRQMVCIPVL